MLRRIASMILEPMRSRRPLFAVFISVLGSPMSNSKTTLAKPVAKERNSRGRPPKKAFINVLVRTSTRAALSQLKASLGLASQGEVIDHLTENLTRRS